MSVIVVVRKGKSAAICGDTQTSQGSLKVPGTMLRTRSKIHRVGRCYVGITGSTAHQGVFTSLVANYSNQLDLTSAQSIFESFRSLHTVLKEKYFVITDEDDDEQEYESNQLFGVICGSSGIFHFQSYREVTEYETYWASGSGAEIALGALHATYASRKGARALAEGAVEAH